MDSIKRWLFIYALLLLAYLAKSSTDQAIFITGAFLLVGLDRGNRHG